MYRIKCYCAAIIITGCFYSIFVSAQTTENPAANNPSANNPTPAVQVQKKEIGIIKYGTEQEVIDLISKLSSSNNNSYNEDLLTLLTTSNRVNIQKAIIDFYKTVHWQGGIDTVVSLLDSSKDFTSLDTPLVTAIFEFLGSEKSTLAISQAKSMLADKTSGMLTPAIQYLGRVGGEEEAKLLLDYLSHEENNAALRQEAIRALGYIGSAISVDALAAIAVDQGKSSGDRMFACEALGKIADPKGETALVTATKDSIAMVRAFAAEALGSFSSESAWQAITESMRDSVPSVRIAAIHAAYKSKNVAAFEILAYKAQYDLDLKVRQEASKELAAFEEGRSFLLTRCKDASENPAVKADLMVYLAQQIDDTASPLAVELKQILESEAIKKDRSIFVMYARRIATDVTNRNAFGLIQVFLQDTDAQIRLGALGWIQKYGNNEHLDVFKTAAESDSSPAVRKTAQKILDAAIGQ